VTDDVVNLASAFEVLRHGEVGVLEVDSVELLAHFGNFVPLAACLVELLEQIIAVHSRRVP
jgi:hypothetical protein